MCIFALHLQLVSHHHLHRALVQWLLTSCMFRGSRVQQDWQIHGVGPSSVLGASLSTRKAASPDPALVPLPQPTAGLLSPGQNTTSITSWPDSTAASPGQDAIIPLQPVSWPCQSEVSLSADPTFPSRLGLIRCLTLTVTVSTQHPLKILTEEVDNNHKGILPKELCYRCWCSCAAARMGRRPSPRRRRPSRGRWRSASWCAAWPTPSGAPRPCTAARATSSARQPLKRSSRVRTSHCWSHNTGILFHRKALNDYGKC